MPLRPVTRSLVILFALFLVTSWSPLISKAQDSPPKPAARKFDEFGDIQISDKIARLDNFVNALMNEPDRKGYVMVYRSRRDLPGLSARYLTQMKSYLVYTRGVPADRFVTIDGGPALNLVQELWIVPPGTTPEVRRDAYTTVIPDRTAVRKFDDYYYSMSDASGEDYGYDYGMPDSVSAFAAAVHSEPTALAYVIAYQQYSVTTPEDPAGGPKVVHFDRPGSARKMLNAVAAELSKEHGLPRSRIRLVSGGFRRRRSVELWIVPAGEHPPIATPNAFPPKRRNSPKKTNHLSSDHAPVVPPTDRTADSLVAKVKESTGQLPARMFDSMGDILLTDLKARADNFIIELNHNPTERGYVVFYRSRRDGPGIAARYLNMARAYITKARGFASDRLVTVDGGMAPNLVQEFWIVPPGTEPPRRADAFPEEPLDRSVAFKFDDYYYSTPFDGEHPEGDSLKQFAELAKQIPRATAYAILYPEYTVYTWNDDGRIHRSIQLDNTRTISGVLGNIRKRLTKDYSVPSSRIKLVNGGYRKQRAVELWIVPAGEHPPIATPNAFPPKRKMRSAEARTK